jgi:hypothetical protein
MNGRLMDAAKAAESEAALRIFLENGDPGSGFEVIFSDYGEVRRFIESSRPFLLSTSGVVRIIQDSDGHRWLVMRTKDARRILVKHAIIQGITFADSPDVLSYKASNVGDGTEQSAEIFFWRFTSQEAVGAFCAAFVGAHATDPVPQE